MILIDYSAICMAAFFARGSGADEGILRHFILNSIRMNNVKYREKYGQMIIACDDYSWRKNYYSNYKANRKKGREKSDIDWPSVFEIFSTIREEIEEHMPYKVIKVNNAEADDVIGALVKNTQEFGKDEPVMIVSSDKDFVQLHKYKNVDQYSPLTKKFIVHEDPIQYLYEHIFKGDSGDGVPNVLSDDDTFVDEDKRQSPLSKKKITLWLENLNDLESVMKTNEYRNYQRNRKMIDLDKMPEEVYNTIIENYESQPKKTNMKILNYLITRRCNQLVECTGDFKNG
tara:strand:+ start:12135 stop:12992 length:858 start_codon:yes stop_codon:yes gene_type:complete